MSAVVDAQARSRALDTLRSFSVTAPAGSGKTELLIQRYLALVARVGRPEQVLAITFTRKAAAEMRERVYQALVDAQAQTPVSSPHEQVTRDLALAVLRTDEQHGWQLLDNISRFSIKTIDSFCVELAGQLPVLGQLGGALAIEEDIKPLYREAVVDFLDGIEGEGGYVDDLSYLMAHLDNNWEKVTDLLVDLLGDREQWQSYIGIRYQPEASEQYLLQTVENVVDRVLTELAQRLAPYEGELLDLLQYRAKELHEPVPEDFPAASADQLPGWRGLASLVLTQKAKLRKKVTVTEGFPPKGENAKAQKRRMHTLLGELAQVPGLEQQLAQLPKLPVMESGSDAWELVLCLSRLLPVLAARLLLVFRRRLAVDYPQMARSALLALGDDDNPTDLALRLDYRIEHILVDEFQDTDVTQFELIGKLTRGWAEHNAIQPDAPRTLFIVGDAMQSIYGFRGANVGLLLKAQREGFNGVRLEPLQLTSNFRSQGNVVDWVNETFAAAFPNDDNPGRAQVSFTAATAVHPAREGEGVNIRAFTGEGAQDAELRFLCDYLQERLAREPGASIGVLGRSRSHLAPLLAAMKAAGLTYYAQDLDRLDKAPAVVDLLVLCRVLANPADRLAALALLRAPWCGLRLADLLALSSGAEDARWRGLRDLLADEALLATLSEDARARLAPVRSALSEAWKLQDRLALRVWIEQAWLALGGPAVVDTAWALSDVHSFMTLLEEADALGLGLDVAWLEHKLAELYRAGGDASSAIQVMTVHKAKGLEFDHVVIPQLARSTRGNSRALLLWEELSDAQGNRAFLLAADDRDKKAPTLYNFLSERRKLRAQEENTRLMYVGATRARHSLMLSACLSVNAKTGAPTAPTESTLLGTIWPAVADTVALTEVERVGEVAGASAGYPPLERVVGSALPPDVAVTPPDDAGENLPPLPESHYERSVGTVVHAALEALSRRASLPEQADARDRAWWRMLLLECGVDSERLAQAEADVEHAVARTLSADGAGRWILSSARKDAVSEWPVTVLEEGAPRAKFIDRSFVDEQDGTRWIVDYKSSRPVAGESEESFIARESEQYRGQLLGYRDAVHAMEGRPVRCGLFFTRLGQLEVLADLDIG